MDKDIAKEAETVILALQKDGKKISTGQIRKFLTAVATVTNKVNVYKARQIAKNGEPNILTESLAREIQFLKVIIAYQVGRDTSRDEGIKTFVNKAKLMERINAVGTSSQKYTEFAKYMEALVAYHKFHGGKE